MGFQFRSKDSNGLGRSNWEGQVVPECGGGGSEGAVASRPFLGGEGS